MCSHFGTAQLCNAGVQWLTFSRASPFLAACFASLPVISACTWHSRRSTRRHGTLRCVGRGRQRRARTPIRSTGGFASGHDQGAARVRASPRAAMAAPWDSAATAVIPVYLINEAACQKVGPLLTQRNQITFRWVKVRRPCLRGVPVWGVGGRRVPSECGRVRGCAPAHAHVCTCSCVCVLWRQETVQAQLGVDVDGSDAYTLLALSRAGPVPMDGDVAVKQHVAGLDAKDCLRIAVEGGELFADMADDPALRRRSVVNSLRLSGLSGDPRSSVRTPLAPSEAAASQRQPASAPQVGGRAAVSATSAAAAAATSGAAAAVAFASVPMVTASPAVGVGTGGAAAGIAPARAAMASGMAMGIHPGAHNFGSGLEGLRLHGPVTYGHGMPPMNSSGGLRMSSSGLSGIGRMSTSGLSQMSGLRMSSSGLNVRMSGSGFSVGSFGDGGSIGPSRRVVPSGSGDTISDITMGSQGGGFMFGDLGALSSMHSNGSAMSGLQPTFSGFSAASNGSFGVGVPRARRAQPSIRHGGPAINNLVGTAGEPGSNDSPATIVARMTEQREAAAKALCMRSEEHKKVYERLRFLLYDPSKLHSPDYDAAMSFTAGTELLVRVCGCGCGCAVLCCAVCLAVAVAVCGRVAVWPCGRVAVLDVCFA